MAIPRANTEAAPIANWLAPEAGTTDGVGDETVVFLDTVGAALEVAALEADDVVVGAGAADEEDDAGGGADEEDEDAGGGAAEDDDDVGGPAAMAAAQSAAAAFKTSIALVGPQPLTGSSTQGVAVV